MGLKDNLHYFNGYDDTVFSADYLYYQNRLIQSNGYPLDIGIGANLISANNIFYSATNMTNLYSYMANHVARANEGILDISTTGIKSYDAFYNLLLGLDNPVDKTYKIKIRQEQNPNFLDAFNVVKSRIPNWTYEIVSV